MRYIAMQRTQKNQQGVAAIEFALVITVLLTICFAIVSFGMLMWTQQKVSHIAGDSARVALQQSILGNVAFKSAACAHATAMVSADMVLRELPANQVTCLIPPEPTPCTWDTSQQCLQLTMTVKVSGLPLVNLVQSLGNVFSDNPNTWIPTELSATSVVKITNVVKT